MEPSGDQRFDDDQFFELVKDIEIDVEQAERWNLGLVEIGKIRRQLNGTRASRHSRHRS